MENVVTQQQKGLSWGIIVLILAALGLLFLVQQLIKTDVAPVPPPQRPTQTPCDVPSPEAVAAVREVAQWFGPGGIMSLNGLTVTTATMKDFSRVFGSADEIDMENFSKFGTVKQFRTELGRGQCYDWGQGNEDIPSLINNLFPK